MDLQIRRETPADFNKVNDVIVEAFLNAPHRDGNEHHLVRKLRKSKHYIPDLSLVAEVDAKIVGHVLFSQINIVADSGTDFISLALAPVSVIPAYQRQKIGTTLISKGHTIARSLGFESVIVVGDPNFYEKLGYRRASIWDVTAPFEVPNECFMAIELKKDGLKTAHGQVNYPPAFGID